MSRLAYLAILAAPLTIGLAARARADIAGHPPAADVRVVEDCLHQQGGGGAPQSCIGSLSAPCQKLAPSPQAKAACNEKEVVVWSVAAVRDFGLLDSLSASDAIRQSLRQVRSDYERAKSELCTFERISRGNSPEALLAASQCRLDATARQDLWLKSQIEALTKK